MFITLQNKIEERNFEVQNLEIVDSTRFSVIFLEQHLSFVSHVNTVVRKLKVLTHYGHWLLGLPICAFASTDAGLAWLVFRGLRSYRYLIRIGARSSMEHAIPVRCSARLNVMPLVIMTQS